MLALAETFELICVFTFLAGSAMSFSYVVLPMYIAEISSAHIRGYLGILHTVMCKIGLLVMYGIGPFVDVRLMAWMCTAPVCLFIVLYYWLPESPYHLIAVDQLSAARVALQKLRRTTDVSRELEQMQCSVKESLANKGTFRELFANRRNLQSIIIVLGLSALIEMSGSQIMLQYAQTIFALLNIPFDASYLSIIFGFVQLGAAIVAACLVDTIGRRPLLLISIVGSGSCTLAIGVYFILERYIDVTGWGWLPMAAILVFMVTYTIGMLSMFTVILSEIFPKHLKAVAGAVANMNSSWIGFALVFAYQYGIDEWGSDYVFLTFSLLTFGFVPFVVFLVPETKGQPLDVILMGTIQK